MLEAIVERIYILLDENDITAITLASEINVHRSAISEWKTGSRKPSAENLLKVASYFDVSLNWFFRGEGVKYSKSLTFDEKEIRLLESYGKLDELEQELLHERISAFMDVKNKRLNNAKTMKKATHQMKVYDLAASAGFGNYLNDESPFSFLEYEADAIPRGTDYGIRISGDSMEPVISDSTIVWVKGQISVDNGDIGIFILNGGAYCKKLVVDNVKQKVQLVSLNESYKPIAVSEHDYLKTVGKVLL